MDEERVGTVMKFFAEPVVAALKIEGNLKVGDKIHIKGDTTDFTQTVESMQIEHESAQEVNEGDEVGIKVVDRARPHDVVYKIKETEEGSVEEKEASV